MQENFLGPIRRCSVATLAAIQELAQAGANQESFITYLGLPSGRVHYVRAALRMQVVACLRGHVGTLGAMADSGPRRGQAGPLARFCGAVVNLLYVYC